MTQNTEHRQPHVRTPHILNTASNLLGFCLIVQTSIRISHANEATLIDECTAVASVFLIVSCILSFISMRTSSVARAERTERFADLIFMGALVVILGVILLVGVNVQASIQR